MLRQELTWAGTNIAPVDPNAFGAEVYRGMAARHTAGIARPVWGEMENNAMVMEAVHQYEPCLPNNEGLPFRSSGSVRDGLPPHA